MNICEKPLELDNRFRAPLLELPRYLPVEKNATFWLEVRMEIFETLTRAFQAKEIRPMRKEEQVEIVWTGLESDHQYECECGRLLFRLKSEA